MHEKRNLMVVVLLLGVLIWAFWVWFVSEHSAAVMTQRVVSIIAIAIVSGLTFYVLNVEDKIEDLLASKVGPVYYDTDGLSFMPTVRLNKDGDAELSLYYQNRYENYCQAIIHLRMPKDSFVVGEGVRDLHFAFKANGGDFGVIHQPIAVPRNLRGDVVHCELAAAVRFPRSHGSQYCSHEGLSCGTLSVDWGQAFKIGVHEVSGEIELKSPTPVHLSMPFDVREETNGPASWKQELLHGGPSESAVLT